MRRAIKKLVGFLLYQLGGAHVLFLLHQIIKGRPVLVVLTYHRVIDGRQTEKFYTDYDRGMDVNLFRRQIEQLPRYFDCVGVETFMEILTGRRPPLKHTALVTFDDADSQFITYAYPVLRSNNVTAAVMVPSQLVESDRQLWHVRISNLVMSLTPEHWETLRARGSEWPETVAAELNRRSIGTQPDRRATCTAINRALDRVQHVDVEGMIDAWEALVEPERHLDVHCMTWDELRYLEEHNIGIESHTASHNKLTLLDRETLLHELVDSKREIEAQIGKTVRAVAYPQGYFDEKIGEAAREAGYEVGFTTVKQSCRYPVDGPELYRIPRMDVVGDTPQDVTLHLAKICLRSIRQT